MKATKAEFIVGVFVLSGVLVIIGLIVFFTQTLRLSRNRYEVSAFFDNVHRMKPGTPVSHLGIDVGAIRQVAAEGNKVKLTLTINYEHRIPIDSTIAIRPTGILGDYYLEFTPGDATKGYLPRDGSGRVEGTPMITIDDVVGKLVEFTAKLEGHLDRLGGRLAELAGNLNRIVGDEKFQNDLKAAAAEVPTTIRTLRETIEAFRDTGRRLTQAADEARALLARIGKLAENADAQIAHQGDNLDKLAAALTASTHTLNATLVSMDEILKRMRAGKGSIGALLNQDDLHEKLVKTVERMNEALLGIKEMTDAIRKKLGS